MDRRKFLAAIPMAGLLAAPAAAPETVDHSIPEPYNGYDGVDGVVYWVDAKGVLHSDRMKAQCINDFARIVARNNPGCTIISLRFCEWDVQIAEWRKEDGVWYDYVRGDRHREATFTKKS